MKKDLLIIASLIILAIFPTVFVITKPEVMCNIGNKQKCLNSLKSDTFIKQEKVYHCKYIVKLGLYCGNDVDDYINKNKFTLNYEKTIN